MPHLIEGDIDGINTHEVLKSNGKKKMIVVNTWDWGVVPYVIIGHSAETSKFSYFKLWLLFNGLVSHDIQLDISFHSNREIDYRSDGTVSSIYLYSLCRKNN